MWWYYQIGETGWYTGIIIFNVIEFAIFYEHDPEIIVNMYICVSLCVRYTS